MGTSELLPTLAVLLAGCHPGVLVPGGPDSGDSVPGPDTGVETIPAAPGPWLRQETQAPGSVTFTELAYHPPDGEDLEWIELFNPMTLDMDLSGWALEGGVDFAFAMGVTMPAGGYLVVAADPAALEEATGFGDALGPWEGQLANGGERLEVRNVTGRLMDTVAYGDDDPWPVGPDGSGFTLAKAHPEAASDRAEHWLASAEPGGTPGAPNRLDPLLNPPVAPTVLLNEIAAAGTAPFWVELLGVGAQDLEGLVLVSAKGDESALPERTTSASS